MKEVKENVVAVRLPEAIQKKINGRIVELSAKKHKELNQSDYIRDLIRKDLNISTENSFINTVQLLKDKLEALSIIEKEILELTEDSDGFNKVIYLTKKLAEWDNNKLIFCGKDNNIDEKNEYKSNEDLNKIKAVLKESLKFENNIKSEEVITFLEKEEKKKDFEKIGNLIYALFKKIEDVIPCKIENCIIDFTATKNEIQFSIQNDIILENVREILNQISKTYSLTFEENKSSFIGDNEVFNLINFNIN